MVIFLAEIGKKSFLFSAQTIAEEGETLSFYFKDKTIKITETTLPILINFRIGIEATCTSTKVKGNVIYFTTSSNMTGRVDISLIPIELV